MLLDDGLVWPCGSVLLGWVLPSVSLKDRWLVPGKCCSTLGSQAACRATACSQQPSLISLGAGRQSLSKPRLALIPHLAQPGLSAAPVPTPSHITLPSIATLQVVEFVDFKQRLAASHTWALGRAEEAALKLRSAAAAGAVATPLLLAAL